MKKLFIALIVIASYSCSKNNIGEPTKNEYQLSFWMDGRAYEFNEFISVDTFTSCGLKQFEVTMSTPDYHYFKINITGSEDAIKPGRYTMEEKPTNRVAYSCSIWYSSFIETYTAKYVTMNITSFEKGMLNGTFSSDRITKGRFKNSKLSHEVY